MNKEQIEKLKAFALVATPGPWSTGTTSRQRIHEKLPPMYEAAVHVGDDSNHGNCIATIYLGGKGALYSDHQSVSENAAFIAAANPAAILELIALAEHSLSAQDEVLTKSDPQPTYAEWRKVVTLVQKIISIVRTGPAIELALQCLDSLDAWSDEVAAAPSPAVAVEPAGCRMQGGICACHSGGSFGGCARERADCCTNEHARTLSPSLAVREKPNADCSGEPANCPDNEGYGCACDPMNKAAMREQP